MLNKFYDALKPGGFLIIGYFDALLPVIDKDMWEYYNLQAKIFRKIDEDQIRREKREYRKYESLNNKKA